MGGRCARSSTTLDWRYYAPPRGRSGTGSVWHSLSRYHGGQAPLLRPSRPAPIKAQIVWKHLTFFAGGLGLLTLNALLLARTAAGRAGLFFALVLVAAYFLHFPDALGFYEGHYLYSLLPLVLYGAASAFKVWPRGTRPVLRAAVTGLLAAALVQSYWRAPDFWARHQSYCGFTRHDLAGTGVSKLNRQRNRRRARAVSGTRD